MHAHCRPSEREAHAPLCAVADPAYEALVGNYSYLPRAHTPRDHLADRPGRARRQP